ncbi:hypothetical protein DLAC_08582 [Tieghemostelium lacteum]|uniref:Thioredoxin domain-containing protein n=1 Tax=Tieghemostelium lacteum TaxID=361077 RepID=A0A151Z7U1_TIELA|nr:hypothetical protein DLAC_08582 [Tieghemostelium lacteum]|eukprot:KYQ90007.1 hypothetical protein DLAC_08582 [Tieghemostelium lacteum]
MNKEIQCNKIIQPRSVSEFENYFSKHNSDKEAIIVYFSAIWNTLCQELSPLFDDLSSQHNDIKFIKVDCDNCSSTQIEMFRKSFAIPTIVAFKNTEEIQRYSGNDLKVIHNIIDKLK